MTGAGTSDPSRAKLCFLLEQDEDGWPPVESENVWARSLGRDEYEVESVPWFVSGIAFGDRVLARRDDDGVLAFERKLAWSGRYTIRLIPTGEGPARDQLETIAAEFAPLGATGEGGLPAFRILALDIPPTAALAEIKQLLRKGEDEGRWGWEEGCVDDRWTSL